ncbi:MAG: DUF6485 family protein [Candidatus Omnitrophica bacterium]|nr:DUF6485 family protein [Candidatus Omnitrophota bacterium]
MHCQNREKNNGACNCSYPSCSRKGICCECIRYHRASGELPACFFSPEAEKTYNRSLDYFFSLHKEK